MAGASLLTLIDDIATLLDDVAVMSKLAVKKTAGVLGDDLALNADQVSGVNPDRELPVVWAVAKGSLVNKVILVPAALALSAFIPWALTPLLMIGGIYLCFEGFEKIAHRFLHDSHEEETHRLELAKAMVDPQIDVVALEKQKIRGAIRTDFILSAEIVVIALATMSEATFMMRAIALTAVGLLITVGVYGLVAAIVKMDDLGLFLSADGRSSSSRAVGRGLLSFTPFLMRALSFAGMIAMFLVGGGILTHGIEPLHHAIEHWVGDWQQYGDVRALAASAAPMAIDFIVGMLVGAVAVGIVEGTRRLIGRRKSAPHNH